MPNLVERRDDHRRDLSREASMSIHNGSWRCHACGDMRPDEFISVHIRTVETPSFLSLRQSFRYCNDRPVCRMVVEIRSFIEDIDDYLG